MQERDTADSLHRRVLGFPGPSFEYQPLKLILTPVDHYLFLDLGKLPGVRRIQRFEGLPASVSASHGDL